jgi:hypothetical protein
MPGGSFFKNEPLRKFVFKMKIATERAHHAASFMADEAKAWVHPICLISR